MLAGYQRVFLRGLGQRLRPQVHVGKGGLSEGLAAETDRALAVHELIKVRFLDPAEHPRVLGTRLSESVGGELVGAIGHVVLIYRQHPDPEKRRIALPARPRPAGG